MSSSKRRYPIGVTIVTQSTEIVVLPYLCPAAHVAPRINNRQAMLEYLRHVKPLDPRGGLTLQQREHARVRLSMHYDINSIVEGDKLLLSVEEDWWIVSVRSTLDTLKIFIETPDADYNPVHLVSVRDSGVQIDEDWWGTGATVYDGLGYLSVDEHIKAIDAGYTPRVTRYDVYGKQLYRIDAPGVYAADQERFWMMMGKRYIRFTF